MKKLFRLPSDWSRQTRNEININWDIIEENIGGASSSGAEALSKANEALTLASTANNTSNNVQKQLDTLVIESGTSDAEVIQARGGKPTLRSRLDERDQTVDQAVEKIDEKLEKIVYLSDFAKGDGTDESDAIREAISAAVGGTLYWDKTINSLYVTRRLDLPSNINISLDPSVTIQPTSSYTAFENVFRIHDVENVNIYGNGATIDMRRDYFADGEGRHAIAIFGGRNINIYDLNCINASGDGILIGGSMDTPGRKSEHVTIQGGSANNNKRLGISVVGDTYDINILNVLISNTNGGSVEAAIDVEPNEGAGENRKITIHRCIFKNNPRGLLIFDASYDVDVDYNVFDNSGGLSIQRINATRANPTVTIGANNQFTKTITSPLTDAAIYVDSVRNIKVNGGRMENYAYPVYYTNTLGGKTENAIVTGIKTYNTRFGVTFESVSFGKVTACRIDNTEGGSVSSTGSDNIDVFDNDFYGYGAFSSFTTTNGINFINNRMRRSGKNVNTAVNFTASTSKVRFDSNDMTDAALSNAVYSESTSISYGINKDIDGFDKPYISTFNPVLSKSLTGQLLMRTQNNRTQLQTVIENNGNLYFVRVPTVFFGTAAPTTGTYVQGDFTQNTAPSELGTSPNKYVIDGWTCIVAGSPGTWVSSRSLTGN